jgi:hypothetical protein
MGDCPIAVIPNPIDLSVSAPSKQAQTRALLVLPADRPLVLFGAMGGGFEGVDRALDILRDELHRTLQLCGLSDVSQLSEDILRHHSHHIVRSSP